jgi:ribonuclease HI
MTNSYNDQIIEIYTDGACLGNPGKGGWGAILLYKGHQKKISGAKADTTNNQMELKAVIEALKQIKKSLQIIIYTDSKYVKDGITSWIISWKRNGWKTADKKPVKNAELWQELDNLASNYQIEWRWVKAHNGNKYNELVDELARAAALELK